MTTTIATPTQPTVIPPVTPNPRGKRAAAQQTVVITPGSAPFLADAEYTTARDAVYAALKQVAQRVIERDAFLPLLFACLVARTHALLIGPPGTAKSLLITEITRTITGANGTPLMLFKRLMSRFTEPDELFGPMDVRAFQSGVRRRETLRMLPQAHVAVLEELFKASSAVNNTLLMLLNEREFDNGPDIETAPLISLFAASNELGDESSSAMYDRLLVRFQVKPLSAAGRAKARAARAAALSAPATASSAPLTLDHLAALNRAARAVTLTKGTVRALDLIAREMADKQIGYVSDRRWFALEDLLQAHAAIDGRDQVLESDLIVAQHVLWDRPEQFAKVREVISQHVSPWLVPVQGVTGLLDGVAGLVAEMDRTVDRAQRYALAGQIVGKLDDAAKEVRRLREAHGQNPEFDALEARAQKLDAAKDETLTKRV